MEKLVCQVKHDFQNPHVFSQDEITLFFSAHFKTEQFVVELQTKMSFLLYLHFYFLFYFTRFSSCPYPFGIYGFYHRQMNDEV